MSSTVTPLPSRCAAMPISAPIVTTPVPPTPVTSKPYGSASAGSLGSGNAGKPSSPSSPASRLRNAPPSTVTKLGEAAALPAAALLGGAGLVVDDRGDAADLAQLALYQIELVAMPHARPRG